MLRAGQSAPLFTLPDADMEMVSLAEFRDRMNVVLYFYPKDDTPGCTREAIDFSDRENDFAELKTTVLGVSRDDCLSHGAFRDKHGLSVRLLEGASTLGGGIRTSELTLPGFRHDVCSAVHPAAMASPGPWKLWTSPSRTICPSSAW